MAGDQQEQQHGISSALREEAFWTMPIPTAITASATLTLPTVQNWHQQQKPPQSSNTAAPEQNPGKMKCGGWRTPPIR